mmetsp:Transcript_27826/g.54720  ORF Transcript_27826/g.54720 Transcript_27826/m.54720 type:complete len:217 (+) Transcript_27826:57-707(+)
MERPFISEITLPKLDLFKVVGDQSNLSAYASAHPPRVSGPWTAVYTQLNKPHSLGTVPYRWDMGYSIAKLLRIRLIDCKVLIVDAPWMPDGSVNGGEKANAVSEALCAPKGDAQGLADIVHQRFGALLCCRETEDQWEVLLPTSWVVGQNLNCQVCMELMPNEYGATGKCRELLESPSSGEAASSYDPCWSAWRRYDDAESLQEVEVADWIRDATI